MTFEHDAPAPPLPPGAEVAPGYSVVGHLSRNQALDVYDVLSTERGCRCVVKVVRPDRTDDRARLRLVREGEVLLGLTHPHFVRVYELRREPGVALVLETLMGLTLGRLVDDFGPLDGDDVADLGLQLCSALGYLHRQGWLHMDLKPSNIVAQGGIAKVLDLSLTRRPGPAPAGIGTRDYASPEQSAGAEVGTAADVWGIGATLYTAATGRSPFSGPLHEDGSRRQLHERAAPVRDAGGRLAPGLAAAIDACLEREPSARPSVAELAAALSPHADAQAVAA